MKNSIDKLDSAINSDSPHIFTQSPASYKQNLEDYFYEPARVVSEFPASKLERPCFYWLVQLRVLQWAP
jgi:hypothetical protein